MDIVIHRNIADLYKSLNLPFEQETDFTIHFKPAILPEIPCASPTYRADYFTFGFVKDGAGSYTIDDYRFPYDSNTIYFSNPGHIKSFEVDELQDAYMITLTESFLRENVYTNIFEEFPFLLAEIVPPKKLSAARFSEFETLYKQIMVEYEKLSVYKNKILGNLFVVLLLKLKEEFWVNYDPIIEGNRNSQIVKSFKHLLESEFRQLMENSPQEGKLQVQHFAEKLNLHPNYLNSVIKSKTGNTVNQWISSRTLSTAKLLLMNTSYSSKEIAYKLGFSEPTHFSRFFKKHTQTSPSIFRKSHQV
ncbi:AraC family transcriptional regulator [marine bacterium AO1-C]|nr:AraC family transcriptional regulator [marine bacterium AO1-C]